MPSAPSGSDLFVQVMKDQGIIDVAAFGVQYTDELRGSKVTFGGIDNKIVPHFDNLTFTNLYGRNYWDVSLTKMRYGDVEIGGQAIRGLIDTGSSFLMLPSQDYNRWLNAIRTNKTCGKYSIYQGCYCDGKTNDELFDPIYVKFDNYEYRIAPDQYINRITTGGRQFCYFLVGELKGFSSTPTAVLGDTFIRNYYIYHDMENRRVGLYGEYMEYYESVPLVSEETAQLIVIGSILVAIFALCCC